MVDRIPDISAEEVDDLNDIIYTNKGQIEEICIEAKKKLTTISTTSLMGIKLVQENQCIETIENAVEATTSTIIAQVENSIQEVLNNKTNYQCNTGSLMKKLHSPMKNKVIVPPKGFYNPSYENTPNDRLYPCLNRIIEEQQQLQYPLQFSEYFQGYDSFTMVSVAEATSVMPSAPSLDLVDTGNEEKKE